MIFHRGAKQKFLEYLLRSFPLSLMFKKYRRSINYVATFAKIQRTREASQHLNFMDNCQRVYLHVFAIPFRWKCIVFLLFVWGSLGLLLWPNFRVQGSLYYYFLWWDSKFYGRKTLFLTIWVERGMSRIWES